jgi:hypothetical protein
MLHTNYVKTNSQTIALPNGDQLGYIKHIKNTNDNKKIKTYYYIIYKDKTKEYLTREDFYNLLDNNKLIN